MSRVLLCVGGTNDGCMISVRAGLRHGSVVDVPRVSSARARFTGDGSVAKVAQEDVIERYRCFWFGLDGQPGQVLVTDAWSDDRAFAEVKARRQRLDPRSGSVELA